MPLDASVESAIEEITNDLQQSPKVSKRLVSWLRDMSERDLSANENLEHLEALKQAIQLEPLDL